MSIRKISGTFFARPKNIHRQWLLIDAQNQILGRLASQISKLLRGKHKPYYTPHINCGDNIILINSSQVKLSGKKMDQKIHYRHTGYPSGLKKLKVSQVLLGKYPERIIKLAVRGMLPKESPLANKQFKCLHVYPRDVHPHSAQKPILIKTLKGIK